MKKILLIGFCVFLTGCFGDNYSRSKNHTEKFKIENSLFKFELTEEWETLTPNNKKGEVILAQKNDENLVITHQNNYEKNITDIIIKSLEKNFFSFKLINKNKNNWQFKGKLTAKSPLRKFYQKIIQIPDSNHFLYASCSNEIFEDRESECVDILKSFKLGE